MKRSKILLVVITIMILSSLFACSHLHALGNWFIDVAPTAESEGLYVQVCEGCGERIEKVIPALSDDSVWTLTETVEPDHKNLGKKVYSSVYGEVTVVLDYVPHVYGDYTLTVNPTLTDVGKATHACECDHVEEVEVPALTDSVWTVTTTPATHFEEGVNVYTSVYGTVSTSIDVVPHVYGDYTLTVNPTLTDAGKATHTCECDYVEEVEVPALTDSVWTVTTVDSTHKVNGTDTYTSVYGSVVIELPLVPHSFGAYTLVIEPTFESVGSAIQNCICGDTMETEVPALTDAIWAIEHTVLPEYDKDGEDTYVSVYGSVTVAVASLVAPFEGKTYHSINFDATNEDLWKNGVISYDKVWSNASITLDDYGCGIGKAYPFFGAYKFVIVDALTGEMRVENYAQKTEEVFVQDPESWDPEEGTWETVGVVDEDGNPVYDWSTPESSYTAWLDMATGLIIAPRNNDFRDVNLYTHLEAGLVDATAIASAWDGAMAIEYTFAGVTHSIFVYDDKAYFGVSFVDLSGNAIAANECYNATNLHVLANDGSLIVGFAADEDGKLVIADGAEGNFVNGESTLYLNGNGIANLNGNVGTYVINDSNIGVYVNGEYLEVTVDGASFTSVKPMVTVTFDGGEYATIDAVEVNKNIAIELPAPTHEQYTFKGWMLNGEIVAQSYAPSASVILVASWKSKVVVTLVGSLEDNNVLYLGEGDVIGDYLPAYGLNVEIGKIFRGWYLDAEFGVELPEDAVLSEEDVVVTVYAKWDELPAYYGTYYGTELYNAGYGNYGGKTLTIDENGNISSNISGLTTGIVVAYDPETQVVNWQNSSGTVYKFYFNAELGVIAGIYNNNDISNDFYFFSKANPTNGKVNAYYGIKAAKSPSDSSRGYYAHFVNAETDLGTREVFLYNNRIYSDFTAVNGVGNPVTAATVKDEKIVVVKDVNGNVIVSVASKGTSFTNNTDTVDLDAYFGTYTNGAETVILDGVGGIVYGDKTGTYALAATGDYFDVYFVDPAEYYKLTLNGTSFEIEKPMVEVVLDGGAYAEDQTLSLNINVAYTLPVYEHATNVFNGWYLDVACTQPAGDSIVPTTGTTLYALWKVKAVLTVVYNNGDANGLFIYSVGDVVTLDTPVKAKNAFAGWYTTVTLDDGSEWANGSAIEEDTTVYAKWEAAPAFYNTYMPTRIEMNNYLQGTSYIYTYNNVTWTVQPNGEGVSTGNPLGSGTKSIVNFNEETGYFEISGTIYYGYVDSETGIIITNFTTNYGLKKVTLFTPFEKGVDIKPRISSSYWNEGLSRVIEYTYEGTKYSIFVHGENVYFGASFKDANGNAIAGVDCYNYKAGTLYVYDANGTLIAKYAHDGSMLQELDGFEGTYATADGEIVVNGVSTITIGGVDGTYTKAAEGASYTHDAYVSGAYYEVTLTVDGYTAVVVKPMVTITYEMDGKAVIEALVTNKNIAIGLPTPENDAFVFRAWYFDAEFNNAVPADFIPTEDVVIYAKWAEKIVLTVVYGNGLDNATSNYAVGDTITLVVPGATNGLFFEGWYEDAGFTVPFTATTISASTIVYCNWTTEVPFTMTQYNSTYAMKYDAATGTWTSSNQGKGSTSSGLVITADSVDIEITFDWVVSSESGWDAVYVYANGQQLVNKSAGSGEKSGTITITLRAGNNLQVYYSKDGSGNAGSDTATISNLIVAGSPVTDADIA